jgi:hypothetical protein
MKGAKGAYGPSYNVQISTDATAKIIVGVGVTQAARDADQLEPAIQRIETTMGKKPTQIVVDAGLVTQDSLFTPGFGPRPPLNEPFCARASVCSRLMAFPITRSPTH